MKILPYFYTLGAISWFVLFVFYITTDFSPSPIVIAFLLLLAVTASLKEAFNSL